MAIAGKKVAVIIPFYKDTITDWEKMALNQCRKILGDFPLIAIKPNHLQLPAEALDIPTVAFNDEFFADIAGYNALMLSDTFYEAFLDYEYILIYQLDAFVFKNNLAYWCNQGFDYIGAPWLRNINHPDVVKSIKSNIKYFTHTRYNVMDNGIPSKYQYENRVGNGGFSLRNVSKFHQICIERKELIDEYLQKGGPYYNEDCFWSIEVNRKRKALNIPGYKTAIKFSVEFSPERAFSLNNGQLPFGCHAWDRYSDFWRPVFKQLGYSI
jgi:hypothetical protein